jgi:AcrR family transcriptional regulator
MSYWDDPKPVRRSRAVDVDELARESAALLDEGGIAALTVRALAARLGVAPPSLYSRIQSVDDLLDLALDRVLGDDDRVSGFCPSDPCDLLLALYDHLALHPWAPQVVGLRPPRGPAYLRFSEQLLGLIVDEGVREPLTVAYAMSNFVIGSVTTSSSAMREPAEHIAPVRAPVYARLHSEHDTEPRAIVEAGLRALQGIGIPDAG